MERILQTLMIVDLYGMAPWNVPHDGFTSSKLVVRGHIH